MNFQRNFQHTGLVYLTIILLACSPGSRVTERSASKTAQPNVIFILTDDLGYSELGCYGNTFNETPNIDRLASQGLKFKTCYAAAPVCSPYRAALMTGQYPARVGITDYLRPNAGDHLSTAHTTLAEMFVNNGYRTGIVGKWHLSGYVKAGAPEETLPDKHGFQEVMMSENEGIAEGWYFHPYLFNRDIKKRMAGEQEYLTDRQNLEAVEFIERNKEKPFFLYLSHYAVHTTLHGKPELVDRFRKKKGAGTSPPVKGNEENNLYKRWPADSRATSNNPHLAAQLFVIDQGVGMIMDKLKSLGLDKNTIIVFTSDNGGETTVTTNAPLRAGKSTLYEGGVTEPMVMWYPAGIKKPQTITQPVVTMDFYPTFMDLISAKPSGQKLDGVSFSALLNNSTSAPADRKFYWNYPLAKPHFLGGRSAASIRKGDWKLIEFYDKNEFELYNLKTDQSEKNNLAASNAAKVNELKADLTSWRQEVNAKTK